MRCSVGFLCLKVQFLPEFGKFSSIISRKRLSVPLSFSFPFWDAHYFYIALSNWVNSCRVLQFCCCCCHFIILVSSLFPPESFLDSVFEFAHLLFDIVGSLSAASFMPFVEVPRSRICRVLFVLGIPAWTAPSPWDSDFLLWATGRSPCSASVFRMRTEGEGRKGQEEGQTQLSPPPPRAG